MPLIIVIQRLWNALVAPATECICYIQHMIDFIIHIYRELHMYKKPSYCSLALNWTRQPFLRTPQLGDDPRRLAVFIPRLEHEFVFMIK